MDVQWVPGEPYVQVRAGNVKVVGGDHLHGDHSDNAAMLVDVTGPGWGLGNKAMSVVDRDGLAECLGYSRWSIELAPLNHRI